MTETEEIYLIYFKHRLISINHANIMLQSGRGICFAIADLKLFSWCSVIQQIKETWPYLHYNVQVVVTKYQIVQIWC